MTLTIDLPPEAEAQLCERAALKGRDAASLAARLLVDVLTLEQGGGAPRLPGSPGAPDANPTEGERPPRTLAACFAAEATPLPLETRDLT